MTTEGKIKVIRQKCIEANPEGKIEDWKLYDVRENPLSLHSSKRSNPPHTDASLLLASRMFVRPRTNARIRRAMTETILAVFALCIGRRA
jgi:hypothetical protein